MSRLKSEIGLRT